MRDEPAQTFWNSVFTQVRDKVGRRNEESGSELKFERIPNGFRVSRASPLLVVESWLDDNNRIHGGSEAKDESGHKIFTKLATLTITGENEASLPTDPMRNSVALTTGDVAGGVLSFF